LVGGSTRIPMVTELLTRRLGRPVAVSAHPKHGVALGAAMVGAHVSGAVAPARQPAAARGTGGTASAGAAADVGAGPPPPTGGQGDTATTVTSDRPGGGASPAATRATPQRTGPLARYGLTASAALAGLALLATLLGPTADPDLTARFDDARQFATLDEPVD